MNKEHIGEFIEKTCKLYNELKHYQVNQRLNQDEIKLLLNTINEHVKSYYIKENYSESTESIYKIENFRFAVEILIQYGDKILICKRNSDAKVAPGIWNVPAGKVKFLEGLEDAIIRETKEETNLEINNPKYIGYHIINSSVKRVVYTYFTKVKDISNMIVDKSEFEKHEWIKYDQIKEYETIPNHLKWRIAQITNIKFSEVNGDGYTISDSIFNELFEIQAFLKMLNEIVAKQE